MTISRERLIAGLGLIVVVVLVVYGSTLAKNGESNKYEGLVTEKDKGLDEATTAYFEQRLATTQAAIKAQEAAGEEVDLDLYLGAASDAYSIGHLAVAREMLEKQIEGNSLNHVAWNNYGHVLEDMEDNDAADAAYREAVELSSSYAKYWEDYADFYAENYPENTEELKDWYEFSVEVVGQGVWNMIGLAKIYEAEGDCDRAVDHYEVAVDLEPENEALEDDLKTLKRTCNEAP